MTGVSTGWRATLVAVLVVGLVGFAGPTTSGATFTDAHDSPGSFAAADTFGGGGPTAEAGGPYSTLEGGSVGLDGTGSQTNNNPSYSWQILSGSGSLTDSDTATPTYHAPADVDQNTTVTVELTVSDNKGSDTDTADVTVQNESSDDTAPPAISDFSAFRSGDQVTVSFTSNESLSTIEVRVEKNNNHGTTMTQNDITTSDSSAPYTYSGTTQVTSGGSYTATLEKAMDDAGNDGANGQQDTT